MSDNMGEDADSIRTSPLDFNTIPISWDGGPLYHFDGARYQNKDNDPIVRLGATQPAIMSLQVRFLHYC